MGFFNREKKPSATCGGCDYRVRTSGTDFCVRTAAPELDIRMLSLDGMKRQGLPTGPENMNACSDFKARA